MAVSLSDVARRASGCCPGRDDAMAIGAMRRFRTIRSAARRPAVSGFDNIAWAQLTDPPLTSVAADAEAMEAAAVLLPVNRFGSPDHNALPAREVRVPATLRPRQPCGCSDRIGSS